jgi:gas vesicle protein
MVKVFRILVGFLFGAVVGGVLALLFAPGSGEATRQRLQDCLEQILAEGQQAAETRRLELTAQFEAMKEPSPEAS